MLVHLADQPAPQLDGPDAALEGAGKHALDHTLYAVFERLQAHVEAER